MEVEVYRKVEDNVLSIYVDSYVRYWEDSMINGVRDDPDEPRMPEVIWDKDRGEYRWEPVIDPDLGIIVGWPKGITAEIHYKVCDEFSCIIDMEQGQIEYEGYVPRFMSPEEENYGDYIIMNISEDGHIEGWNKNLLRKFIKSESYEINKAEIEDNR